MSKLGARFWKMMYRNERATVDQIFHEIARMRAERDRYKELYEQEKEKNKPTASEIKDNAKFIEDGFGSVWEKCDRDDCSLQVVRPGKAQCDVERIETDDGVEWVQPCVWKWKGLEKGD